MSTLAERFHMALDRNPGMIQADLARACGISTPSVSNWFSGRTKSIKNETARLAAQALGCDQNWLAEGVGQPNWSGVAVSVMPLPEARKALPIKRGDREILLRLGELLANVPDGPRRTAVAGLLSAYAQDGGAAHYVEALLPLLQRQAATDESLPHAANN